MLIPESAKTKRSKSSTLLKQAVKVLADRLQGLFTSSAGGTAAGWSVPISRSCWEAGLNSSSGLELKRAPLSPTQGHLQTGRHQASILGKSSAHVMNP